MSGSRYQGVGGGRRGRGREEEEEPWSVVPHAPTGQRKGTAADKDIRRWRRLLHQLYPILTPEQISRADQPFHMILLHDMIHSGDSVAAQELHSIFRKEEKERHETPNAPWPKKYLKDQRDKLCQLADNLKVCHLYLAQGNLLASVELRKKLGEKAMHNGDIWLAKHFFLSCLTSFKNMEDQFESKAKLGSNTDGDPTNLNDPRLLMRKQEAEVHCLLAFLARETKETLETALAVAIEHLAVCRNVSHGQPWQFKPKILTIKLKKPIAIHGLRTDESQIYDVVDGCSMTVYMIATLLEHELLISLANQIMHSHRAPTDEDVKTAHEFADHALKLALEVRHPTAMASALVRFGLVLRHSGAHDDAMQYFEDLQQHAMSSSDYMTEAIAYHNIALCHIGTHKSKEALEFFTKQLEVAKDFDVQDLQADAMYEMGHLLLQEGHLWEAEECYAIAFENFKNVSQTHSHSLASWSMLGISAGHKLWGRFATLCRHNRPSDLNILLGWKFTRRSLSSNARPSYRHPLITKAFSPLERRMVSAYNVPTTDPTDWEAIVDTMSLSLQPEELPQEEGEESIAEEPHLNEQEEEEDWERTELDVSMSQLDTVLREESSVVVYARWVGRRVSSTPMVNPHIKELPPPPPTRKSQEEDKSKSTSTSTGPAAEEGPCECDPCECDILTVPLEELAFDPCVCDPCECDPNTCYPTLKTKALEELNFDPCLCDPCLCDDPCGLKPNAPEKVVLEVEDPCLCSPCLCDDPCVCEDCQCECHAPLTFPTTGGGWEGGHHEAMEWATYPGHNSLAQEEEESVSVSATGTSGSKSANPSVVGASGATTAEQSTSSDRTTNNTIPTTIATATPPSSLGGDSRKSGDSGGGQVVAGETPFSVAVGVVAGDPTLTLAQLNQLQGQQPRKSSNK